MSNFPNLWVLLAIWVQTIVITSGDNAPTSKSEADKTTFAGEYSFVGTLEIGAGKKTVPLCVVTALTKTWVLTAYSCVRPLLEEGDKLTVAWLQEIGARIKLPNFNLNATDIGENTIGINKVVVGAAIAEERLVLLRLSNPLSSELIRKVKLGTKDDFGPKTTCVNVGWSPVYYPFEGEITPDPNARNLTDVVQNVSTQLDIINNGSTSVIVGRTNKTDKALSICKFEVGSPLLCKQESIWKLVGIIGYLGDDVVYKECTSSTENTHFIFLQPQVRWMYNQMREKSQTLHGDSNEPKPTEKQ